MADLTRGTRPRRGARRPGWLLLTVLLVLAIGASSALVFTSRVELLKLAVILALWAAVVAAFVSVIYRRQSDIDQAKVRDLKLVYDLQLDREISARREYELSVETQLRRELISEIRAQATDEVAGLRAELAALRANLEILFDADLSHRPALETDRGRVYSDWPRDAESAGRVTASRIDTVDREDVEILRAEEEPLRRVGSPQVMAAQLAHLTGVARLPNVTIQVVPDIEHAGLLGGFAITDRAAYAETAVGGQVFEDPEIIALRRARQFVVGRAALGQGNRAEALRYFGEAMRGQGPSPAAALWCLTRIIRTPSVAYRIYTGLRRAKVLVWDLLTKRTAWGRIARKARNQERVFPLPSEYSSAP